MSDKCQHTKENLGYLNWHYDAERRQKKGEEQKKCPVCKLWIWESHYFKTQDK